MCGIVGYTGAHDEELIKRMMYLIEHRGPDDDGIYYDEQITLGHKRLSIIDIQGGKQPIFNENKSVIIVYNGEVFNFQELKANLKKKHKFKTKSDTEVLIHLYEEEGINFVKKLNGMFAFALWDENKKTLYLVRDSTGIKPLYYTIKDRDIYFASEIKALIQSGIIAPKVNSNSLKKFMFYRYIPDAGTMFEKVNKLLPGEIATFSEGQVYFKTFISLKRNKTIPITEDKAKAKLFPLLNQAVKSWLISDVPVGAFLSGGIDSSTIVALAKQNTKGQLNTYSVEFDTNDSKIKSEIKFAKKLCDFLKIKNQRFLVKETDVIRDLPLIAWHYDEPMGDAAVIPTFFVAKEARNSSKVVLAGEGGDEQFGGYEKYKRIIEKKDKREKIEKLVDEYLKEICVFNPVEMLHLFKQIDGKVFFSNINPNIKSLLESPKEDILNNLLSFDQKTMLCENYFMKGDKMTMAHGLEERVPFMDKNLLSFTSSLPEDLKIKDTTEKYILKETMRNKLPKEIIERQKQGYGTPTKDWFKGKLGRLFKKRIKSSEVFSKFFYTNYITRLYEEHKHGIKNHNTKLWCLLAFDLWYEIYIRHNHKPQYSYEEFVEINKKEKKKYERRLY